MLRLTQFVAILAGFLLLVLGSEHNARSSATSVEPLYDMNITSTVKPAVTTSTPTPTLDITSTTALTSTPTFATFTNTPTLSATPTTSATPTCLAPWVPVSSPNEGFNSNYLHGVATLAADDAWAVGYFVNRFGMQQTLIQHWDGVRWSIVASPNVGSPSTTRNFLLAVSAISPDDIWAVGYDRGRSITAYTLILHWNGQLWSMTNTAIVGVLNAVSKVGSDDVWAVGTTGDLTTYPDVTPLTLARCACCCCRSSSG